jgi:DNA-binding transcriptional regulator YdaS (Cro superfamily)
MTPVEQSQSAALAKACDVAGSQSALAVLIGGKVKQAHVFYWLETGRIPAQHCPTIERETRRIAAEKGDQSLVVTCEQLCDQADWSVLRESADVAEPATAQG